jgi:hypothetical protein
MGHCISKGSKPDQRMACEDFTESVVQHSQRETCSFVRAKLLSGMRSGVHILQHILTPPAVFLADGSKPAVPVCTKS